MADESNKLEMFRYKYIPKNIELTIDKNYEFRDGTITYINLIHDYKKRRVPVIQCGLEMETAQIEKLYKYKNTARIKIEIHEQKIDKDGNIVGTTLYLQHTFSIIPMRDPTVYITSTDQETEENTDKMQTIQNFEMYLIDMEIVNRFTKEESMILEKTTYASALQAVFIQREVPKGTVIATPPLQDGKIDYAVIPLQDMIHTIYHINGTYGLYDGIPIIYHDLKYLYCIAKMEPNIKIKSATDFTNVVFLLADPDEPEHNVTGSNDDAENETHWINLNDAPDILDTQTRDVNAKFSTLATVNSKGEVDKTTLDENATTLKYAYSSNPLSSQQMMNEMITGHILALIVSDISVKFIKPYKDYMFKVGDSYKNLKLENNIYRILGWTLGIHREGTDKYISEVTMTLYNPKRDPGKDPTITPQMVP